MSKKYRMFLRNEKKERDISLQKGH
jgi:hypothetical protein